MPLSKQLIIFIMISITPALALSAGFSIQEQSTKGLGRALSGSAAIAEDASTIFFNPAGLTQLKNNEFILGSNFLFSDSSFEDKGSTGPTLTGAQPLTGKTEGINFFVNNAGSYAFIPNLYYAHILTQDLVVGLGITAPFGLASDYDDTWIGRYHALHSSLIGININPSFGYKWNDKLSVGFGISAQYSKIKLSNAIDFGSLCTLQSINTCAGVSDPSRDGIITMQASDLGWGYNVGLIYQLTKLTRLGLSYRSKISHNFKGHAGFELPDSVQNTPLAASFSNQNLFGSLELPENISFSTVHKNGKWQYTSDITWTRWSRFQKLQINSADPNSPVNSNTPYNWRDNLRIAIGADYQVNHSLSVRTGLAYDASPVPEQTRGARIPGEDRYWFSLGASYQITPAWQVDAAYVHVKIKDPVISQTLNTFPQDHQINGRYTVDIDILSLQLRWQFD
ncbi:MAG TPA: long-chain fatty acid transporter [Gammaproteobacteria bacterium]|nr:long-chain fatty acid transporter [Gammaproteobacteria bacterium]